MCPGAEETLWVSKKHCGLKKHNFWIFLEKRLWMFKKPQIPKYHRSRHETKILMAMKVIGIEPVDLLGGLRNECFIVVDCVVFGGFFVCVFGFFGVFSMLVR